MNRQHAIRSGRCLHSSQTFLNTDCIVNIALSSNYGDSRTSQWSSNRSLWAASSRLHETADGALSPKQASSGIVSGRSARLPCRAAWTIQIQNRVTLAVDDSCEELPCGKGTLPRLIAHSRVPRESVAVGGGSAAVRGLWAHHQLTHCLLSIETQSAADSDDLANDTNSQPTSAFASRHVVAPKTAVATSDTLATTPSTYKAFFVVILRSGSRSLCTVVSWLCFAVAGKATLNGIWPHGSIPKGSATLASVQILPIQGIIWRFSK